MFAGFVTEVGGQTSHTAIMARSIELPAVVAVEQLTDVVATGDELIVDATRGVVLVNPTLDESARLKGLSDEYAARKADIDACSQAHSITQDGVEIAVWGNIESAEEASVILTTGRLRLACFERSTCSLADATCPMNKNSMNTIAKFWRPWNIVRPRLGRLI